MLNTRFYHELPEHCIYYIAADGYWYCKDGVFRCSGDEARHQSRASFSAGLSLRHLYEGQKALSVKGCFSCGYPFPKPSKKIDKLP